MQTSGALVLSLRNGSVKGNVARGKEIENWNFKQGLFRMFDSVYYMP